MKTITVPNIGDLENVPIIEILVGIGDTVIPEQPLVVIETDKAALEIPSSEGGVVASMSVKLGDRISEGAELLVLGDAANLVAQPPARHSVETSATSLHPELHASGSTKVESKPPAVESTAFRIYAGPGVRRAARQHKIDLKQVQGTGPRGRILAKDLHEHLSPRSVASQDTPAPPAMLSALPPWPKVDYGHFGPIESRPLSRIRKISGANLHRNWLSAPHVTNHDDADVTDLEAFRAEVNSTQPETASKVSPLSFVIKACVTALRAYPEFNSSLEQDTLVLKHYYHIGFAADTPNGLVVPVIRSADTKGILEITKETAALAAKARLGKLSSTDIQGGTFSISNLGGIGGSYFTPIINVPEVAILGIGRTQTRVSWLDGKPQPRLYLPLSLSWDHRVIDGAAAGRFNACLVKALGDLRQILL